MIGVKDGLFVITLPNMTLVLQRLEFIAALRKGKQLRRHEALARRLVAAAEVAARRARRGRDGDDDGGEGRWGA